MSDRGPRGGPRSPYAASCDWNARRRAVRTFSPVFRGFQNGNSIEDPSRGDEACGRDGASDEGEPEEDRDEDPPRGAEGEAFDGEADGGEADDEDEGEASARREGEVELQVQRLREAQGGLSRASSKNIT